MAVLIAAVSGGEISSLRRLPTNGSFTLQGFSGSAVSSLTINQYSGRLADVLDVKVA